ncbi:DUF4148 domain-containing protein [Paraburkholderia elongata]|uniref:DUF4148 domain-containing protein n=1 Tax=Paraburkholderia elongata TaxID=2675747 RepID=A0A972P340_9BURK|nr:DUF4148 domain-containing protein [Paraburkholderia elongata]NPT62240.1 DUF4148 domain-containing protein [Paraburkholderia elongata]
MNFALKTVTAITAFLPAMASLAQSNQPLTRAHVTSELIQLEKAGFRPTDWLHYPQNILEAQARVEQAANTNHSPAQTQQDRSDGHSEGNRQ